MDYGIGWSSKRTKQVALSSTEAEIIAAAEGIRNTLYSNYINTEKFQKKFQITLHEDHQRCINWLQNAAG